ncbi:MAG: mercuric reductase [Alkalispirochaeta sp.]
MNRSEMLPDDQYNRTLLDHVHPLEWQNPQPSGQYNLVVLGGGTAGLITAAVAASMGARTALIERGFLGGDCLNVGCVPSKGLIRGARGQAELIWLQQAGLVPAGGTGTLPSVDFPAVMERLRRIRSEISGHDSAARYRDEFGVDVYIGNGSFTGRRSLSVIGDDGSTRDLSFSKAVIATGARAAAPPIPGLDSTPYLTNESLFTLTELPDSMVIIGAGPIGCEMAQSFARLGSRVELVEAAPRILPREDADVATIVHQQLESSGVTIHVQAAVSAISGSVETGVVVQYQSAAGEDVRVEGSRLLVAIGRKPNLEGLNLEQAGVKAHARGIEVNDYLQTSNSRVFAAGDVASPYQFTHMAEATASLVVQNALFFKSGKSSRLTVPWCTYTSPEVAHVGISEQDAHRDGISVDVYRHEMSSVDRARLDGETDGFIKLITSHGKTQILGATIVAAHAGEMIGEIVLAMQNSLGVDKLASVVHPYPTQSEAVKRAAAGYLKRKLTPRVKRIMEVWFRWNR